MTEATITTLRSTVVGVPIDAVSMAEAVDLLMSWSDSGTTASAVGVNASVCNMAAADAGFRAAVLDAELRYADGHSIVGASQLLGRPLPERIALTDLVDPLIRECATRGKRVFLLGGAPGLAERAADALTRSNPGLEIEVRNGYGELQDDEATVDAIISFGTDVLMIGLGDPPQQLWISDHRSRLPGVVMLGSGGLFSWVSGDQRRAPAVMLKFGLEWLWRLILEPRRLAKRYVLGNPVFIARLLRQLAVERASPRRRAESITHRRR